jgi:hypothetical protein
MPVALIGFAHCTRGKTLHDQGRTARLTAHASLVVARAAIAVACIANIAAGGWLCWRALPTPFYANKANAGLTVLAPDCR